jgi:hypothetical protein
MSYIKSKVMSGLFGAFALASGSAIASAETNTPTPSLLSAPAEVFTLASDGPGDSSKQQFSPGAITVAQVDATSANAFVAQATGKEVAAPQPVERPKLAKATPKSVVFIQKRTDRIASLEHGATLLPRLHGQVNMLGVGY